MSTTSLKLPEDLKQLVAAAARHEGATPHAFMVEAIRSAALASERRAALVEEAVAARTEMLGSGVGHPAGEVHDYLRARARGEVARKPGTRSWRD